MIEAIPITEGTAPAPKMGVEIYLLDRKQVEHYWPRIEAELEAEPDLWSGWWTLDAIMEGVMNEVIQTWVVSFEEKIRSVFMTHILCAPAGRILQVFWIRGSLPDGALKRMLLALDHFGQHHNCLRISVVGRRGWERRLRDLGAVYDGTCLTRPIVKMARN